MPALLDPTDDVVQCVATMTTLLRLFPVTYLLINGHIEMQLKGLFGCAWISPRQSARSFVMDKQCGRPERGGAALDLIAFENRIPQFWVEIKCTFAECNEAAISTSGNAIEQAAAYLNNVRLELAQCPGYIVHFLTSLPRQEDSLLPEWILKKFARLRGVALDPDALERYYENTAQRRYHSSKVVPVFDGVDAIIVRLQRVAL